MEVNTCNTAASATSDATVDAQISPTDAMAILSRAEQKRLLSVNHDQLHHVFRSCALAVLNCGGTQDNTQALLGQYRDFQINIIQCERGIKVDLTGAPAHAFVDGKLINSIRHHLFAVLRDILMLGEDIKNGANFDLSTTDGTTDAIFHILRHAGAMVPGETPNTVVCWGGHAIGQQEYEYTHQVGYQLGLRGLDVCTGCGPGAMKGPMKGAWVASAMQCQPSAGRFIGLTEPSIIAAESPNTIVNNLIILPDIEKRLEAFVRLGHGFIVFPGGPGTTEEILFILGVLLHPDNRDQPFPLIFTGPKSCETHFYNLDQFIRSTLGPQAAHRYEIIIDDPIRVARIMHYGMTQVKAHRLKTGDAYHFNWRLTIDRIFQTPFDPTHANMAALHLHREQPTHILAAQLRRAFSGVVAATVKAESIEAIQRGGPYEIQGDADIMAHVDILLASFTAHQRMKVSGHGACYRIKP